MSTSPHLAEEMERRELAADVGAAAERLLELGYRVIARAEYEVSVGLEDQADVFKVVLERAWRFVGAVDRWSRKGVGWVRGLVAEGHCDAVKRAAVVYQIKGIARQSCPQYVLSSAVVA